MGLQAVSAFVEPVRTETKKARLLLHYENPSYRMERDRGGLEIRYDPIHADIDNRAFFDSLGLKSVGLLGRELVDRGKNAVLEGMARSAREGDLLAAPRSGGIAEIAAENAVKSIETMLVFIPERPSVSWEGGDVGIEYTPDRLRFEWKTNRVKLAYEPYDVEFNV